MKSKKDLINEKLDELEALIKQHHIKDEDLSKELAKRKWCERVLQKRCRKIVNRGLEGQVQGFVDANIYAIMAALVVHFGFGRDRLYRFMNGYEAMHRELRSYYECGKDDVPYYCERIVKQHGFDLDEWTAMRQKEEAEKNAAARSKA